MPGTSLKVAVVGLRFGAEFVPLYQLHPDVGDVVICDTDPERLRAVGDQCGITERYADLDEVLADRSVDAVHLVTPIGQHAEQSVRVLDTGKHCACTIPIGLTYAEIESVMDAQKRSGKVYMNMETAVYTRECLYVRARVASGDFGEINFARGAHLQDMTGWPDYWKGFPPILHITHAVSPVLSILDTYATKVVCFGSGRVLPELEAAYGSPFAAETAVFELANSDVAVEVTRSMFGITRPYVESFSVYGNKLGFEWPQLEGEPSLLFTMLGNDGGMGANIGVEELDLPDDDDLLPEPLRPWTRNIALRSDEHLSVIQGGSHGGSHPHLVNEFVSSIVEEREPAINALTSGRWAAAGIAAHKSAMSGGAEVRVPSFVDES